MTENSTSLDPLRLDTLAFVLLLAVLPLVSYGATQEITALWMLGLLLLAVGVLIPLATEFGLREDEEDEGAEEDDEGEEEAEEDESDQSDVLRGLDEETRDE